MKKIVCICNFCKIEYERPVGEYNRSVQKNRPMYCSRICSAKGNYENNLAPHKIDDPTAPLRKYWSENSKKDQYNSFKRFLRSAKRRFHEANKEFDITLEQLKNIWDMQNGICPLTGWKLNIEPNSGLYQASVDRIDSKIGYVNGNVRFVAVMANYCKHVYSDEEVILFCKAVAEKHS